MIRRRFFCVVARLEVEFAYESRGSAAARSCVSAATTLNILGPVIGVRNLTSTFPTRAILPSILRVRLAQKTDGTA